MKTFATNVYGPSLSLSLPRGLDWKPELSPALPDVANLHLEFWVVNFTVNNLYTDIPQ
ncbi:hypothetical protein SK128_021652, partial [Halocaridina rubra]